MTQLQQRTERTDAAAPPSMRTGSPVGRYVVRRVAQFVPVLIATTLVIYAVVYALPGDPVQTLAGTNQQVTPAVRHAIEVHYHLTEPFLLQYWHYLVNLVRGDFGTSIGGTSVSSIIAASWSVTAILAFTTWVIQSVLGVTLGTLAGLRNGRGTDVTVLTGATLVIGVPYFVLAFVLQIVLGVRLHLFPTSGLVNGWPEDYVLPALALAAFGLPEVIRMTRSSVIENLAGDYVDTAVAKGVPYRRIVSHHILRNSWLPITTILGTNLGYLLSGTVLIEGIFNLPGLGYQLYLGIQKHDGPVVVGISTLFVLLFLIINLLGDLLHAVLDPRIRLG